VTLTFDLEDNRRSDTQEARFVAMSDRFLGFLEERGITATVFVVGSLAREHPELVRRVAEAGHEIGLHGLRHVALGDVGRSRLGVELREGREILEDVAQVPVKGYRAPIFSLTPSTAWAVAEIRAAGHVYSSSVLPAASPLHGWPGAPRGPFLWDDELLELPCPVIGIGRLLVPLLGGVYLRYLPPALIRSFVRSRSRSRALWSYCHPYDLDPDEPFFVMPHAGWLTSRLLHMRRSQTLDRLTAAIEAAGGPGQPLGAIAEALRRAELPSISSTPCPTESQAMAAVR
jgi:polysaccharide deacetylase family protein (PEP-CTERM system associated)